MNIPNAFDDTVFSFSFGHTPYFIVAQITISLIGANGQRRRDQPTYRWVTILSAISLIREWFAIDIFSTYEYASAFLKKKCFRNDFEFEKFTKYLRHKKGR